MKIALVGNQNCGKTTLFNALTGSNQKVGNWAGVTVEKKTGIIKGTSHELIDLPGIYSMTPYTSEEAISCNYILNESPDLIINLVDTTCLERSLYLTTQLINLNNKIILALNMNEILEKKGQVLDEILLSKLLSIPCIKISAIKNENLDKLIKSINNNNFYISNVNIFPQDIENIIEKVSNSFSPKINKFSAITEIEKFSVDINEVNNHTFNINKKGKKIKYKFKKLIKKNDSNKINTEIKNQIKSNILQENIKSDIINLQQNYNLNLEHIFAYERYNFISKVVSKCINKNKITKPQKTITEKLDKIFLNKFLAIPIFICIMALIYFLSVGVVGKYSSSFINDGITSLSNLIENKLTKLNASSWIISLLCDGIITGVGSVLNFVPQLIILFLCIALLETTGYMSRISFILDKLFVRIGLSGKSLIPFIVGSGCSVPAIMSTRTIENQHEKQTTIMLTPFIPCSAKLPIIALFSSYFFARSWLITSIIYLFAIVLIIVSAFIIRKFILTEAINSFIFELPEYKKPSLKYVFKDVLQKTSSFIKRAGTIILLCSIIIWVLVSFNLSFTYGVNIEDSILAKIGGLFSWIFYPILNTNSWAATVSAIQGLVAKEQVVSSMAVIAGLSSEVSSASIIFNPNGVFSFFTPVTAISFIVFNLFSAPCFGAIGAMRKELGSTKKTLIAIAFQTFTALLLATLITFFGNLIMIFL